MNTCGTQVARQTALSRRARQSDFLLLRFVPLQRRANQLLAASPEGYRQYWARNLRQRRINAKF
ncbi:MAG: hypothetical protein NTV49_09715 [Kiritimatiellaeota bacterium]|nr:hypothetical protein [Kiritimatiellota bacterium]